MPQPAPRRGRAIRGIALVSPLAVAALIAGCGGGGSPRAAAHGSAAHGSAATVATRHTAAGTVLVDGGGRTLYMFDKDRRATSMCDGACLAVWPALRTGSAPRASGGALASKLGTTKRSDGTVEVTYGGHPLYTYVGDAKPGDTHGQGLDQFGAKWYVLARNGKEIDDD